MEQRTTKLGELQDTRYAIRDTRCVIRDASLNDARYGMRDSGSFHLASCIPYPVSYSLPLASRIPHHASDCGLLPPLTPLPHPMTWEFPFFVAWSRSAVPPVHREVQGA